MARTGGAERRRQLVAEATTLFGARGYDATSLDAVAEAAGVRKQSLLYHFPAKEDLFDACVLSVSEQVAQALTAALDRPFDDPWERTDEVIGALFRLAERAPAFPAFVREAARRGPDVVERFSSTLDPLRKRALTFLESGMQAGTFRRQDPVLLLFMIYTAVVGSLTEAGVLQALSPGASGRAALRAREAELRAFVRSALSPSIERD